MSRELSLSAQQGICNEIGLIYNIASIHLGAYYFSCALVLLPGRTKLVNLRVFPCFRTCWWWIAYTCF